MITVTLNSKLNNNNPGCSVRSDHILTQSRVADQYTNQLAASLLVGSLMSTPRQLLARSRVSAAIIKLPSTIPASSLM